VGGPTSANAAPYLIIFSIALSVDLPIIGEYFFNNRSSSWSDERIDSAYADIISWLQSDEARHIEMGDHIILSHPVSVFEKQARLGSRIFERLSDRPSIRSGMRLPRMGIEWSAASTKAAGRNEDRIVS